jgi:hypothetical protein
LHDRQRPFIMGICFVIRRTNKRKRSNFPWASSGRRN